MTTISANNIAIEYEEFGPKDGGAIILVRGLGTQLIYWPEEFYRPMVETGHRVILFDNRDVGLSSKMDHLGQVDMKEVFEKSQKGETFKAPYTLDDMALDMIGLMDGLGLSRAHIVGISLGGMIAQTITGNHPDRIFSMTSIMSSSGNPDLPQPAPEIVATLVSPPGDPNDRESKIEDEVRSMLITGSPGYPVSEEFARDLATRAYDRCYHPDGVHRQMAAARALGDRRSRLNKITRPALVVHGCDDVLIPITSGEDTAANIPGAKFVAIPGMGHDIPPALGKTLADIVLNHITHHNE